MARKDGRRLVLAGIAIGFRRHSRSLAGLGPALRRQRYDPLTVAAATLLMIAVAAPTGFAPRTAPPGSIRWAMRHE
jgi:hypothetical protein